MFDLISWDFLSLSDKYRVFKAFFIKQRALVFNFAIILSVANTYSLYISNKDSK